MISEGQGQISGPSLHIPSNATFCQYVGLSHVIMMMCERGVISNGGQEVKMAITPMEETVTESPYCKDLEPVSRKRYKQLISKYVGRDPYLIKKSEFSVEA